MSTNTNGTTFTPWNTVALSATIGASRNTFSGTTTAASAPGGAYGLNANATGHIDGAFYRPNGQELGAIWSLSNHDNTGSALGELAAKQ